MHGAILPAALRGLVAAGWFGINSWLGGLAIHQMLQTLTGGSLGGGFLAGALVGLGLCVVCSRRCSRGAGLGCGVEAGGLFAGTGLALFAAELVAFGRTG